MKRNKQENVQRLKQRRFLTFLPLIIIPFLMGGFYAFGGGRGKTAEGVVQKEGFNAELPGAVSKEKKLDKLGYYSQAAKDSAKRSQQQSSVALLGADSMQAPNYQKPLGVGSNITYGYDNDAANTAGLQEAKIYQRLAELNRTLNEAQEGKPTAHQPMKAATEPALPSSDIDRLEKMMQMMGAGKTEDDPEMEQINATLQNILDIQHPERVEQRLKKTSKQNRGQVFAVTPFKKQTPVTLLDNKSIKDYAREIDTASELKVENGFYSIKENYTIGLPQNAIEAVVHETQTLVNGATIKLRLLNDIYISGQLVPKDNFVYGMVTLRGERLGVEIESIRYGSSLLPVQLSVYDLDGLSGIKIPGAITRDVAKQSGDQTLQSLSLGGFDPSLGAQAASAGIEVTKNLLSKKIKLIKVEVKAGYKVLLKDEKKKEGY